MGVSEELLANICCTVAHLTVTIFMLYLIATYTFSFHLCFNSATDAQVIIYETGRSIACMLGLHVFYNNHTCKFLVQK